MQADVCHLWQWYSPQSRRVPQCKCQPDYCSSHTHTATDTETHRSFIYGSPSSPGPGGSDLRCTFRTLKLSFWCCPRNRNVILYRFNLLQIWHGSAWLAAWPIRGFSSASPSQSALPTRGNLSPDPPVKS